MILQDPIETENRAAVMDFDDFEKLPEYSLSNPTDPEPGFMWKRRVPWIGGRCFWYLAQVVDDFLNDGTFLIMFWKIILVEEEKFVYEGGHLVFYGSAKKREIEKNKASKPFSALMKKIGRRQWE